MRRALALVALCALSAAALVPRQGGLAAAAPKPSLLETGRERRPEPQRAPAKPHSNVNALTVTLVKNLVGAGAFALPAGLAADTGLISVVALTLLFGYVSAWTFYVLGDAARRTRTSSYRGLWGKTVGAKTAWIADSTIVAMSFGSCVQFTATIVLLMRGLFGGRMPPWLDGQGPLVGLTTLAMLPLCVARSLHALAWSSAIGVLGVLYAAVFVVWRYAGRPVDAAAAPLAALAAPLRMGWTTFALMGTLNTVFLSHFNVPRFWRELESGDIDDFRTVTKRGFGAATALYLVIMVGGYLTFGEACKGRILLDLYERADAGAMVLRAATLVSVVGGYPLAFIALRDSSETLLGWGRPANSNRAAVPPAAGRASLALTLGLLGATSAVALFATDVGLIIALRGALLGSLLVFVLPALVGWACDRWLVDALYPFTAGQWIRRKALYAMLIAYGATSSVVGTAVCARDALRAAAVAG